MIDVQAMFPVMVASDLAAIKEFYTTAFEFNVAFFDANFYLHLVSPSTGIQLGFLLPNHTSQPQFLQAIMSTEGYVISFEVIDAAKAHTEAQSMGLTITMDLTKETWGQYHFMIEDPAGFKIDIVEHLNTTTE